MTRRDLFVAVAGALAAPAAPMAAALPDYLTDPAAWFLSPEAALAFMIRDQGATLERLVVAPEDYFKARELLHPRESIVVSDGWLRRGEWHAIFRRPIGR